MKSSSIIILEFIPILLAINFSACQTPDNSQNHDKWKTEIVAVEKAFNDLAQQEGLSIAFEKFAATDGVILRGGDIIKGAENIGAWYQKNNRPNTSLTWVPEFVDISKSGDLAYTYGPYEFTSIDSTGTENVNRGFFHTVWKRQPDGSWKFVWD